MYRFKTDKNTTITSVVFHCRQEKCIDPKDNKPEKSEFMKKISYRIVGPYLCYRKTIDDKLRIRKIFGNEDEDLPGKERHINLKYVIKDNDEKKFIAFHAIPATSF